MSGSSNTQVQHTTRSHPASTAQQACKKKNFSTAQYQHSSISAQPNISTAQYQHSSISAQLNISTAQYQHSSISAQLNISTAQYQHSTAQQACKKKKKNSAQLNIT